MKAKVNIVGADELAKVLKKMPAELNEKILDSALRKGAQLVANEAKHLAPKDTGKLAKSIVVQKAGKANRRSSGHVIITAKKGTRSLLHLLEFGTRYSAPRPFLRPAMDAKEGAALNEIGVFLGKKVEKAAVKLAGSYAKSGLKKRRRRR